MIDVDNTVDSKAFAFKLYVGCLSTNLGTNRLLVCRVASASYYSPTHLDSHQDTPVHKSSGKVQPDHQILSLSIIQ